MKIWYSVLVLLSSQLILCANIRNTTDIRDASKQTDDDDASINQGPIRISLPTNTPKARLEKDDGKATAAKKKSSVALKNSTSSTKALVASAATTFRSTTRKANANDIVAPSKGKVLSKGAGDDGELMCPKEGQAQFQLFPLRCGNDSMCKQLGKDYRCCEQYGLRVCLQGTLKPLKEQTHQPFLGIQRRCPTEPLAEFFWQIQTCNTDQDCWPRICCPDGRKQYCRTARPEFESLPFPAARQLSYPFEAISGYLQCTPPPPPVFDSHPKVCNNTLDCFPNVCCQEAGKKHCRPPKRSLLALVAGMTQRFGFLRQLTDNIVIRK